MMRRRVLTAPILMCAFLTVCVFLLPGCEDDDDASSALAIAPASVRIASSASTNVVFRASGGTAPYTWQVDDGTLGSLVSSANTAIYTSVPVAGRNYVTVMDVNTNAMTATIIQG